jgi:rhomboid protease GluP
VIPTPHTDSYREIYRSHELASCEQRAFVLRAVGLDHAIGVADNLFVLYVPQEQFARALEQLASYERENANVPKPAIPLQLHEHAGRATLAYALVLILAAYCAGAQVGGFDWFQIGALTASVSGDEAWRVVTALTLHADIGHLLGNLAFGSLFGFFAAQLIGAGSAWLSILLAGALGNWVDSALMSEGRTTIGASTAVFATLGMVAAFAWKQHTSGALRWAHRWAPLIAAVALLAFTGSGGERTDVLAHLTGFAAGALIGLLHALPSTRRVFVAIPQIGSGIIACAIVIGAWVWGFASQH